ncbi:TPR/glycosyl transferase domain protein [Methanosarcina barkeri 3]|uniref:TPR/glycosyl transferase domain protein n=1 Tax=Methanosarcina barkeri 3 TaxID=1434107 RepID=A0A0E3SLP5_METBA|nr:glycosyltransferase family 4 protein [Methanosarcina barkeri]AKB82182.1 TPR/glycosyl transferase domain protein [Methanosarcina barkeri 3]
MKKALIVACYFPPEGGPGVQRTAKFVKYLDHFGWDPIVLTSKKKLLPTHDPSLLEDLPSSIKITRTFTLQPRMKSKKSIIRYLIFVLVYSISIPDLSVWWIPFALYEGFLLIKKEKIDIIYVTGDPFSSYIIGIFLKLLTGKPLILDFRDAWILDPRRPIKKVLKWKLPIENFMFNICVKYADKVVLATNSMKSDFITQFHKYKSPDDFIAITNGFDVQDLKNISLVEKDSKTFNLVYCGSLNDISRDPIYLFKALSIMKREQPDIYYQIKLYLVGNIHNNYVENIYKYCINDCVILKGYQPHSKSLGYLEMADVLVFIMETGKNVRQITSGKVFEYIAFGKPILALAPKDSDAADIIKESKLGIFANPTDEYSIYNTLLYLFDSWKNNKEIIDCSSSLISKYSRENLTKELAFVFNVCS